MATVEEANEFLCGIAGDVDVLLEAAAPSMTFALVIWKKGEPANARGVAIFGPPDFKHEQPAVFRTAAQCIEEQL